MTDTTSTTCRSHNVDGSACIKTTRHGHMKHSDGKGQYWTGGIRKPVLPAVAHPDRDKTKQAQNDHMTEADYILNDRYGI